MANSTHHTVQENPGTGIHTWEKIVAVSLGTIFLVTILIIAIVNPDPNQFQYEVFKIVLAIACAGIAAILPGFIDFQSKFAGTAIRAGGPWRCL